MPIFNRIKEIIKSIRFSASPRLYGRYSSGAGEGEEITVGTGLSLAGGVLSATITNSVTSATTSDGTAELQLGGVEITTNGSVFFGDTVTYTYETTESATAHKTALAIASADITFDSSISSTSTIAVTAENAYILTTGDNSGVYTSGGNSGIFTSGAASSIYATGDSSAIYTTGASGHIYTDHASANIRTRGDFRLFDGTYVTSLNHTPTSDNAIAFPDASGTVALAPTGPYANDAAAATGGVSVGQLYYTIAGAVIRRMA